MLGSGDRGGSPPGTICGVALSQLKRRGGGANASQRATAHLRRVWMAYVSPDVGLCRANDPRRGGAGSRDKSARRRPARPELKGGSGGSGGEGGRGARDSAPARAAGCQVTTACGGRARECRLVRPSAA